MFIGAGVAGTLYYGTLVRRAPSGPALSVAAPVFAATPLPVVFGIPTIYWVCAVGDWFTALVAMGALAILFRWKVSNPLLMAATALAGLIAFPLLHPSWMMLK